MDLRSFIPVQPLRWWNELLLALIFILIATGLRSALNTVSFSETPYAPFITAVLVCAVWGGLLSGLLAAGFGAVISTVLFVQTAGRVSLVHLWSMMLYLMLCLIVVATVETMKSALRREAALNDRLQIVGRELHHRVKNVVTIANSLAQQTGRNAATVEEYQQKLTSRLVALARAQDLLFDGEGSAVRLSALIDEILSPFEMAGHLAAPISGPEIEVAADHAVTLCLVLNELATNATKYGALSTPEGKVSLSWTRGIQGVRLQWIETQGPAVKAPTRLGFGSRLFNSALPRQVGSVEIHFDPEGVRCFIILNQT